MPRVSKNPVADKLTAWRLDPILFVREVFGAEPDDWQAEVLRAFPTHQRLALKASKGPGKTTVLSWLGWNFLITRSHPKIPCTSITGDNLRDGLWAEFAKWQNKMPEPLRDLYQWSAERIVNKRFPQTWWASARSWSKGADATQQANTLAGIHEDYVLVLVDEAGGIPDGVVAAAEAALSTGIETKILMAGNPTHLEGPLYRACVREKDKWFVKEISGDPDDPKRAKRVDVNWARDQIQKWGKDHPWVLVNVYGKFPPGQSNTMIAWADAEKAMTRNILEAEYIYAPRVIGIDVARFGDDRTVIFPRQGRVAFKPEVYRTQDNMAIAGAAVEMIRRWKPHAIFVDETGVGSGVVDRLRELKYSIIGVNSSSRASDPRAMNMRAQMWLHMSEWFKAGNVMIPNDEEIARECASPTYKFTSDGQIQVEAKADMKKRGIASPDLADALALTFSQFVGIPEIPGIPVDMTQHAYLQSGRNNSDYDPLKEDSDGPR